MTNPCLLVYCTCPNHDTARQIAHQCVTSGTAACVNMQEVNSVFRWDEKLEQAQETLLIMKTTQDRYPELEREILQMHPYELPEIIAVSIDHGHQPYLQWVAAETNRACN